MIYFMSCYWIKFPSLKHEYPTEKSAVKVYSDCNGSNSIATGRYCDIRVQLRRYGIDLAEKPIRNLLFKSNGSYEYTVIVGPEIFVG